MPPVANFVDDSSAGTQQASGGFQHFSECFSLNFVWGLKRGRMVNGFGLHMPFVEPGAEQVCSPANGKFWEFSGQFTVISLFLPAVHLHGDPIIVTRATQHVQGSM